MERRLPELETSLRKPCWPSLPGAAQAGLQPATGDADAEPRTLGIARTAPALASDATATSALGYLHANCGHCHNPRGTAWPDTQMLLRLELDDPLDERSGPYQSVVSQRLQYFRDQRGEIMLRVDPGHPESSGLVARMAVRGPKEQMPALATEQVDAAGLELMRGWIAAMLAMPPR